MKFPLSLPDLGGSVISMACAIHCALCVVAPAAFASSVFRSEVMEGLLLLGSLMLGAVAWKRSPHRHWQMGVLFAGAAVFMTTGFVGELAGLHVIPLMVAGGVAMVAGHVYNMRCCMPTVHAHD